jgi:predicted phosphodiesterase
VASIERTQENKKTQEWPIRFAIIGDSGMGNEGQARVAKALLLFQESSKVDFIIHTGDIIYPAAPSKLDHDLWRLNYEIPYSQLGKKIFCALGNHDLSNDGDGSGSGQALWKHQLFIEHAKVSGHMVFPERFYSFKFPGVQFWIMDTTSLIKTDDQEQMVALKDEIETSLHADPNDWKILVGHHPWKSPGPHGNAGQYDGLPSTQPESGIRLKDFLETKMLPHMHMYLSGHDHIRSIRLGRSGLATSIVSGTGASHSFLRNKENYNFAVATLGFVTLALFPDKAYYQFIDVDGKKEFSISESRWEVQTSTEK